MNDFTYRDGALHAENIALTKIAEEFGTPAYIYSRACLERNFLAYQQALDGADHLICYAVKANSNLAVLDTLARLGAGFDIVSIGELQRVLQAGGDPDKIVYSGVAKTATDMRQALAAGIHCFNVESTPELEMLNEVAGEMQRKAPVSLRINPDVDARTHPYISTGLRENKFGIAMEEAFEIYQRAAQLPHLEVLGVDCHIGSQLTEISPFIDALQRLLTLIDQLAEAGVTIRHLDLGGGLGVRYRDEQPPEISDYIAALRSEVGDRPLQLLFEPGRSITANAGVLLTTVNIIKHNSVNNFAIVDAAMNDMIRPALYQAWLDIVPISEAGSGETAQYDVVGPVCETGDFLGKERHLAIAAGDLLAIKGAGAYGFTMSSNYNSRTRAPEIMVDGDQCYLVRERETLADLWRGEHLLPAPK
ncbi:diaminopimelate decarboxylase [Halieaceae bacterium IMCC14734]|uniref:Diaminopimelate decarboxylase n=1 Tax=Candidatus Litorirhabdus singularis TaxID=2518993 RepID=A0ABT3TB66_9GAMM|nr:diaminopimelate decarboxylase [Candidatus Litorirhabdus singularis]MCX2979527.1 diaminopimelate decarboxylase [Candidatus Litorirhabdus singularis]